MKPGRGTETTMLKKRESVFGTLGSQVTTIIGRRIVSGRIAPGQVLPAEGELCQSLGVSRTTLREAVKQLQSKGLVAVGPKSGTRVLAPESWSQFDLDVLSWRIESGVDRAFVEQLYELRDAFEPQACALAATNGTVDDHEAVAASFRRMEQFCNDPDAVSHADVEFHMAIIAATHNMFFTSLGSAVSAALRVAFESSPTSDGFPPDELQMHGAIVEAIKARQEQQAADVMRALIRRSRASLIARLNISGAREARDERTATRRNARR